MILPALAQVAVAAGVAASAPTAPAPADTASRPDPRADAWLGADKAKHFLLAGFSEAAAFAAARAAGAERRPALVISAAVAGGISIGKELVDRTGRGQPSVRDLVWDAAGIVAYAALLARTAR